MQEATWISSSDSGDNMMILKALHIANFKAFAIAQRMPLRPITLIYGANSAGKSSILHALALAHHAIETGDIDTQQTRIGGEIIDLGGFRQYVHRRDREKQVELRFELDPKQLSGRVSELLRSTEEIVVELVIGEGITSEQQDLFGDQVREIVSEDSCRVERFAVEVDGALLLSMSARAGGLLRLDRLEHGHPAFRELFRGILMLATTAEDIDEDDFVVLGEVLDGLVPRITARLRGLFPRIEEKSEGSESKGEGWDTFVSVSRGRRREDLSLAARTFVPKALRELVGGLGAAIEGEIRRLYYLGPLRSYPPRHLTFSQHHDPNWFAGGGYAWDVVRKRGEVRRRVNAWLGDPNRLQTNYELVVRDLLPSDLVASELSRQLDGELHDLLASIIARVADREQPGNREIADDFDALFAMARDVSRSETEMDFLDLGPFPEIQALLSAVTDTESLSEFLAQRIVDAQSEEIRALVLVDQRTDTPVSHRDVGIGVSQVLPVLVAAYASTEQVLAIEQPEIHLHPALQAELGDVFIESALGESRNTFLIETHSEHLLLRIMRRMRETSTGKLPDGIPEVRPEHIMVVFVEPDGARSLIREMPLNERGELVKAWPGGFFEEGLREIF
jgi:ABC-type ATPase involved in cell division